jgi:D-alanyl-D-alanine carboxypeptidase (penicillin-binding protein 5/6)
MNGYAQKMGLTNTTFMTVHGLDAPGQFSTARDMALLTKAMIHDVRKSTPFIKRKSLPSIRFVSRTATACCGAQTSTRMASKQGPPPALATTWSPRPPGDMRLIAVVLGTKTDRIRFNESAADLGLPFLKP